MYTDGKDPLELLAWDVKCLIDTARDACEFNENTNILTVLEYASKQQYLLIEKLSLLYPAG